MNINNYRKIYADFEEFFCSGEFPAVIDYDRSLDEDECRDIWDMAQLAAKPQWIPASKAPTKNGIYLTIVSHYGEKVPTFHEYKNGFWYPVLDLTPNGLIGVQWDVIYYMPLPPAPPTTTGE